MRKMILSLLILLFFMSEVLPAQTFISVDCGGMTYTMDTRGVETVRDIWVQDFQMAATEVTVAQWREFIDDTGMDFPWEHHYAGDISELSPREDCPIQLVRIDEVVSFCNWLSLQDGLKRVYLQNGIRVIRDRTANGYRLPTTEEWDYAARGGRLSHGYIYAGSNNPDEVAWYNIPIEEGSKPVGTKAPNELGLYDMSGSVSEWTWPDIGIPYYIHDSEELVYIRGGCWVSPLNWIRLDFDRSEHVYLWSLNGFRLAKNAD